MSLIETGGVYVVTSERVTLQCAERSWRELRGVRMDDGAWMVQRFSLVW